MLAIILLVVAIVSLISLIGVFTLSLRQNAVRNLMFVAISFAAGTMLAAAFLDLIPEALEEISSEMAFGAVLLGILVSFAVEKFLYHYHCHAGHECKHPHKPKPYAYLNLIGDGIHNFLDGVIIAVSFLAGEAVGIATSIAVIAHEIPQEIGDFATLVHGGFTRSRALWLNFLISLTAALGAIIGYYFSQGVQGFAPVLAAFAAGNFIYIASSDLIPEMHHEQRPGKSTMQTAMLIFGVLVVWLTKLYFEG